LQAHFNQAGEDIRLAIVSVDKIEAHGDRIREVELERDHVVAAAALKLQAGE
jgi:hypothetical protein